MKSRTQKARTILQQVLKPRFAVVILILAVAICVQSVQAAANITGTVYADFNGNGTRDNASGATANQAADIGVAGVTVKAYDAGGAVCDTQTSSATGTYTLNMSSCSGSTFRVEFSNFPSTYRPTQVGPNNATTTQFVAAGGTADLGVNKFGDFSQNNPTLLASVFAPYDSQTGVNTAIKTVNGAAYNASGTAANTLSLATHNQTGAVWGLAYRKSTRVMYESAYMKAFSDFGPGAIATHTGAIYKSAAIPASQTGALSSSLFINIPNAGTDPHPTSTTNCNARDGSGTGTSASGNCWFHDAFSYAKAGKTSLGDVDIYEDPTNTANDALFVVNLNDRNLYKVTDLDSGGTVQSPIAMPLALPGASQGCAQADVRPFGLGFNDGVGYATLTCTAQSTASAANLRAYVYNFNPQTGVFSSAPVFEFPLNYPRGSANDVGQRAFWKPWTDVFNTTNVNIDAENNTINPSPIVSDLAFGPNGALSVSIRDRFADEAGNWYMSPANLSSSTLYLGMAAGDILRACQVSGVWTLENTGTCNGLGPGTAGRQSYGNLPQGPGNYEFYRWEHAISGGAPIYNDETTMGGLANIPGFNEVSNALYDPIPDSFYAGGTNNYNTTTGNQVNTHQLYAAGATNTSSNNFAKANGLGDLEVISDSAPIEIGNRVWKDTNSNGVQDPGEAGIAGVTVHLYNGANTLVGTAVSDTNGNYLFSNRTTDPSGATLSDSTGKDYGVTGLTASTNNFTVKLDNAADYTNAAKLQGLTTSPVNSTTSSGNAQNDSDAVLPSALAAASSTNAPTVTFATGTAGNNDHTEDFGMMAPALVSLGNFVWNDTNGNGIVDGSEATGGANGVTVKLYTSSADTNSDGSLSAAELAAATAVATTTTANDSRAGATNGRPGYYSFANLAVGSYFVSIPGSNFGAGNPLLSLIASPVPSSVGDTQDDNKNHGSVPAGGTLATNGVVSTSIILTANGEPTTSTTKPDDDTDASSDNTIDFGFTSLPTVSLGNFVWLDTNGNGIVDGSEATSGINGVSVKLYAASADTNSDGSLSASELAAATAVATTTTANDPRAGATNGRSGYYTFNGLTAGSYFVNIAGSNFGAGVFGSNIQTVVPSGVGDTQDDNKNHGAIPAGGTLATNGLVSTKITLTAGAEPTASTTKTDDDTDANSDMTIDFAVTTPPAVPVSLGNFVWLDANSNGAVDGSEATAGINGVTVKLYASSADSNNNGSLSAAELAAATAVATTTTANDSRAGATNGRPGYYSFSGLTVGSYFVSIPGTNFGAGTLGTDIASPIPSGVGDTQDDNKSHGSVPTGGSLATNGVVSTKITLANSAEPTTSTTKTDDDTDANSDMTIDFGFALPPKVALGNFVWLDANGNGIVDGSEATSGINGVSVKLYASSADTNTDGSLSATELAAATVVATTTTANDSRSGPTNGRPGYYGFTNLNPGSYFVSITASNFGAGAIGSNIASPVPSGVGDTQDDNKNHGAIPSGGSLAGNGVVSTKITLTANGEPTTTTTKTDDDTNDSSDNTIDFGFIAPPKVSIGNYIWFDSNNNGSVDNNDNAQGLNNVTVKLYASSADTNADGSLSPAELSSATALATTTTMNDPRTGATNGRSGYYSFGNLDPGGYFVAVPGSNFGVGQPLNSMLASPVPSGVGDTQDDNKSHGAVPAGGTLTTNGVASTKINLTAGAEPTTTTTKTDDDTDSSSDTTIDFGFWHSYSLGNRVWHDIDNSATINAADGVTPGLANVKVNLYAGTGTTQLATTTTDTDGYYRFDNLNAGSYTVEIDGSNFGAGQPLVTHQLSSIAVAEEANPNDGGDSNDNGINPSGTAMAVRSGVVVLGPNSSAPIGETDLATSGQGTVDDYANMTVDFGFIDPPYIGDTVYFDYNGDGTQNGGEPGIANVTVDRISAGTDGLFNTGDDVIVESVVTNSQGKYIFSNFTPGTYLIKVHTTDVANSTVTTTDNYTTTVSAGQGILTDDFGFKGVAGGTIGNQVWKEVVPNGVYSTATHDAPLSGVIVELYNDINGNGAIDGLDSKLTQTTTDTIGQYQFDNLLVDDNNAANGTGAAYIVKVANGQSVLQALTASTGTPGSDDNAQNTNSYPATITSTAPSNQTADFGYHGSSSVGDTVYYDVDGDATQDTIDRGVPGIAVSLEWAGPDNDITTTADNQAYTTTTDSTGKYSFTDLLDSNYKVSITIPTGDTLTTSNQGLTFALPATTADLNHDFGLNGSGTIGNQVFYDYNNNQQFGAGEVGAAQVTLDLYNDVNGDGLIAASDPAIASTTTASDGTYQFSNLLVNNHYIVRVSDTGHRLDNVTANPGVGTADNGSKNPSGYAVFLTSAGPSNQTADFGYVPQPNLVDPPSFTKTYTVDGPVMHWKLVWINDSSVSGVTAHIEDAIPAGTTYVASSYTCVARGSSTTTACDYNTSANTVSWDGVVGDDLGNSTESTANNEIVLEFDVRLNPTTTDVTNQANSTWDQNGDGLINSFDQNVANAALGKSDDPGTSTAQDPDTYHRTLPAAGTATGVPAKVIAALTNTGQGIAVFVAISAGLIALTVIVLRRKGSRNG